MRKSLLSILIATSVLATTVHAGTIYDDKKGTTLDFSGTVLAAMTTFDKDPSTVHGTAIAGDDRAITDQSYMNLKLTGKSYFNDDGWYGIGHWYGRLKPKNSLENRELYAGVGSDKYGQLVYGKMYAAFYQGITVADIGLNYDGQSYDTPLPFQMQDRSANTAMYSYHGNNLDFYLSSMLDNGQYHTGSGSYATGGSTIDNPTRTTGVGSSQQMYGQYAFGSSGFSAGLGYATAKMQINATQPGQKADNNVWSSVGNLLFQSKQWFAGASLMTGQTYTTGSFLGDGMGNAFSDNFVDTNPAPLAGAKFYTALLSTTYTIQKSTVGLMWEYGQYHDIEQGILTNKMAGKDSATFSNTVLANYTYQFNTHVSAGVEYLYDTTSKSNPYHQGNGLYLQAAYNF